MPEALADYVPAQPDFYFESCLWEGQVQHVAGLDEAGRGALAGPVVAAAVVFPPRPELAAQLDGVRDSKQMTPATRELWAERIKKLAAAWAVGAASHLEIDQLGILPATRLAMQRALHSLPPGVEHLLLDFVLLPEASQPQTALVKGDQRSLSIAAASILAKTSRDAILCELDAQYPGYGFSRHKGYGTTQHRIAIQHHGPCPCHRRSFTLLAPQIVLPFAQAHAVISGGHP